MQFTGRDAGKLNGWVMASRDLLKAGEDKVVRTNNDTLYKMAFVYLGDGPVVLRSDSPSKERFSSFQLQDDRNANYRNIVHPDGSILLVSFVASTDASKRMSQSCLAAIDRCSESGRSERSQVKFFC